MRSAIREKAARVRGVSHVRFLQMRVTAAEEALVRAKESARRAKRQRKIARLFFKRARKHAKEAKANLNQAREALARAELKAMPLKRRVARARKGGRASPRASRPSRRPAPTKVVAVL